ncbi:hypothetical protein Plec18170_001534 [Paecilomyces lecythidis]
MLSSLPLELLIAIVSEVTDRRDMKSLCEVSKLLYSVTVPFLYKSVTVRVDYWGLNVTAVDSLLCASRHSSINLLHYAGNIQISQLFRESGMTSLCGHPDKYNEVCDEEVDAIELMRRRLKRRLIPVLLKCRVGMLKSFV